MLDISTRIYIQNATEIKNGVLSNINEKTLIKFNAELLFSMNASQIVKFMSIENYNSYFDAYKKDLKILNLPKDMVRNTHLIGYLMNWRATSFLYSSNTKNNDINNFLQSFNSFMQNMIVNAEYKNLSKKVLADHFTKQKITDNALRNLYDFYNDFFTFFTNINIAQQVLDGILDRTNQIPSANTQEGRNEIFINKLKLLMNRKHYYSRVKTWMMVNSIHYINTHEKCSPYDIALYLEECDFYPLLFTKNYMEQLKITSDEIKSLELYLENNSILNVLHNDFQEKIHNINNIRDNKEKDRYIMFDNGAHVVPAVPTKEKHADYGLIAGLFLKKSGDEVQKRTILNKHFSDLQWLLMALINRFNLPTAIFPGRNLIVLDIDSKITPIRTEIGNYKFLQDIPSLNIKKGQELNQNEFQQIYRQIPKIHFSDYQHKEILKHISGNKALYQTSPSGGLHIFMDTNTFAGGIVSGPTYFNNHRQYIIIKDEKGGDMPVRYDIRSNHDNVIMQWNGSTGFYSRLETIGFDIKNLNSNFHNLGNPSVYANLILNNPDKDNIVNKMNKLKLRQSILLNKTSLNENEKNSLEKISAELQNMTNKYCDGKCSVSEKVIKNVRKYKFAHKLGTKDCNISQWLRSSKVTPLTKEKAEQIVDINKYITGGMYFIYNTARNGFYNFTKESCMKHVDEFLDKTVYPKIIPALSLERQEKMRNAIKQAKGVLLRRSAYMTNNNLNYLLSFLGKPYDTFYNDIRDSLKLNERNRLHLSERINDLVTVINNQIKNKINNDHVDPRKWIIDLHHNPVTLSYSNIIHMSNRLRYNRGNHEINDPHAIVEDLYALERFSKMDYAWNLFISLISYVSHRAYNRDVQSNNKIIYSSHWSTRKDIEYTASNSTFKIDYYDGLNAAGNRRKLSFKKIKTLADCFELNDKELERLISNFSGIWYERKQARMAWRAEHKGIEWNELEIKYLVRMWKILPDKIKLSTNEPIWNNDYHFIMNSINLSFETILFLDHYELTMIKGKKQLYTLKSKIQTLINFSNKELEFVYEYQINELINKAVKRGNIKLLKHFNALNLKPKDIVKFIKAHYKDFTDIFNNMIKHNLIDLLMINSLSIDKETGEINFSNYHLINDIYRKLYFELVKKMGDRDFLYREIITLKTGDLFDVKTRNSLDQEFKFRVYMSKYNLEIA